GDMVLANLFLLVFGLMGVRIFAKIIECPRAILVPLIIVLAAVGAYAVQNSIADVYWMLAFGILGYFLKMYGFEMGPIILGVILGPLMDASYRRAMIAAQDNVPAFLWEFVANPISLVLTLATLLLL